MTNKDTIIAAQEAEIFRLQGALDAIKKEFEWRSNSELCGQDSAYCFAFKRALGIVNEITGASND